MKTNYNYNKFLEENFETFERIFHSCQCANFWIEEKYSIIFSISKKIFDKKLPMKYAKNMMKNMMINLYIKENNRKKYEFKYGIGEFFENENNNYSESEKNMYIYSLSLFLPEKYVKICNLIIENYNIKEISIEIGETIYNINKMIDDLKITLPKFGIGRL